MKKAKEKRLHSTGGVQKRRKATSTGGWLRDWRRLAREDENQRCVGGVKEFKISGRGRGRRLLKRRGKTIKRNLRGHFYRITTSGRKNWILGRKLKNAVCKMAAYPRLQIGKRQAFDMKGWGGGRAKSLECTGGGAVHRWEKDDELTLHE